MSDSALELSKVMGKIIAEEGKEQAIRYLSGLIIGFTLEEAPCRVVYKKGSTFLSVISTKVCH